MSEKWQRIRALVNAALDLCEAVERLQPTPEELARPLNPADRTGSKLGDILDSARLMPLQAGNQLPGIDESNPAATAMARSLVAIAALAGRAASAPAQEAGEIDRVTAWFQRVRPDFIGALERGRDG